MFRFMTEVLGFMLGEAMWERIFGDNRAAPGSSAQAPPASVPGPNTRVLFRRLCAFVADLLLVFAGCYLLLGIGRLGASLSLLAAFAVLLLYRVAFEASSGRTPAKSLFRIRVVPAGRPHVNSVGLYRAVSRNILLLADLILMSWLVGLLIPLLSDGNRRLGDLAAGTLVVRKKSRVRAGDASMGVRHTRKAARGL